MTSTLATDLLLIRHAPVVPDGRLAGRRDVHADCSNGWRLGELRARIGAFDHLIISPALRCLQTATALWPERPEPETDQRLWEQDFGSWEGVAFERIPDLGSLEPEALVDMRPPGGESFGDLCARCSPSLEELAGRGGRIAVVAHAGTVRAALSLALGLRAAALSFHVAPLSLTQLTVRNGREWSIGSVNWSGLGRPREVGGDT